MVRHPVIEVEILHRKEHVRLAIYLCNFGLWKFAITGQLVTPYEVLWATSIVILQII